MNELVAIPNEGFEGDRCRGSKQRQVLLINTESLDELGFQPGQLREQVTVEFPGLQALPIGSVVRVGDASFVITADCEPCTKMANNLGEDPEHFKARADRKRGMLANVLDGGTIRIGDEVILQP
ncbi:MAG TPA: MOSC domain-containing protein [Fimbriimonadaceae bacterium]|nr:MOSC domain-containing protein [Fimbriimonadaceae bacterium]